MMLFFQASLLSGKSDLKCAPLLSLRKIADFTVITTDNPRYEEPMEIISEIEKGLLTVTKNYVIIQDRRQAIEYALGKANAGDTIVVCGKGSERYQDVYGIKNLFNDKDTVMEILRG